MTRLHRLLPITVLCLLCAAPAPVAVAEEMDHSAHMQMLRQQKNLAQSEVRYQVPDVVLRKQDGEEVRLREFLADAEPYALNFIFTTCTTICPILTSSFSQMQRELGAEADGVQLISITIDPEYDTPKVLKAYAKKVGATRNWTFLTGDYATIKQAATAFNAYAADKMEHRPIYLFKFPSQPNWIRIDGLASGAQLADVYLANFLF